MGVEENGLKASSELWTVTFISVKARTTWSWCTW